MILRVTHTTRYEYLGPVTDSFNELRVHPLETPTQNCLSFEMTTDPSGPRRMYQDFYYNTVHVFEASEPHDYLEISLVSEVETFTDMRPVPPVPGTVHDQEAQLSPEEYYDFTGTTVLVPLVPDAWKLAVDSTEGLQSVWDIAWAVMGAIYNGFEYKAGVTEVSSGLEEALRLRRGVCQDFAHVMLGMLRSMRIACRYASGYFYAAELEEQRAAAASHAWVECFIPNMGWVGFDPTHNRLADERYVLIGRGRDYTDIRPFAGTYRGPGNRSLEVSVAVEKLSAQTRPANNAPMPGTARP